MSPSTMTVMKEKRDAKPLLKFGLALVLSFAGIIFSRFGTRRSKSTPRLPPPRSSAHGREAEVPGGRVQHDDGDPTSESASCCSTTKEIQEDQRITKMNVDTSRTELSQNSKYCAEKDEFLLPEFDCLVSDFNFGATDPWKCCSKEDVERDRSDAESAKAFIILENNDEQEILQLKNMIRILQEKERNHEIQLLEYYGLKEQEKAVIELQNRIELANMETKILSFKIQSLQSENGRLETQVANHAKTVSELEAAKEKIKMLKKKLWHEAKQNKEQILKLQEKVGKLQDQDIKTAASDQDMQEKLQRFKDLECEAQVLRESCLRLQEENSDLAEKLESTQILANSVMEDPEACAWKQECEHLREENKVLAKEIEQQLSGRCSDLEELVYLRWINACLRYELRNYQPEDGMPLARDLSKTLSPKSEKKAKQLILEYANEGGVEGKGISIMDFDSVYWSSSQASGDCDDSSTDFSSATRTSFSSKAKFLSKLRKLVRGNDSKNVSKRERIGSLEDASSLCSSSMAIYPHRVESTTPWKTSSGRYLDYQVQNLKDVKEQDTDIGLSYRTLTSMSRRDSSDFRNSRRHSSGFRNSRRHSSDFRYSLDLSYDSSEKSKFVKYAEL